MLRHLLGLFQICLGIFLVSLSLTSLAFAKKITLEWTPTKQTLYYEIQVKDSSGKKPALRRVDKSRYQANLDPGVYFWQVRAIDRLKRPGLWSDPEPLVVMSAPPSLESPQADSELKFYSSGASVLFKWKPAPGASAYVFTLSKDGSVLSEKEVNGTSLETPVPDSGKYSWTVRAVLTPGTGAPSAFHSRRWESDSSKPNLLSVEYSTLAKANIIEPAGKITIPKNGTLRFAWSPVENAERYEIRLKRNLPVDTNRTPDEKVYYTGKTSINVALKDLGTIEVAKLYSWTVRPLPRRAPASLAPDHSEAGLSRANFEFSAETRDFLRRGIVEFRSFLAPTSYRFVAPDSGNSGDTSAIASGLRISGDRYPGRSFGYGGSFENTSLKIENNSYSLRSFEIGARYRKAISEKQTGWLLNAHLGIGLREYMEIFPTVSIDTTAQTVTVTGSDNIKLSTLGPTSGVDLKRFLNDHWTVQLNFAQYLPLMKMGSPQVGTLQSAGPLDNVSLSMRAGWESRIWGYTAGMIYERRRTKFNRTLPEGIVSSNTDETSSTALSFFAGVSYSFY